MTSIQKLMSHDHRFCDSLFARTESSVADKDWENAEKNLRAFVDAMWRHFDQEEKSLFPAYEVATGGTGGPTMMMRHEHQQMHQLMNDMTDAVREKRLHDFLGLSETLLIFMQQHNIKEEQILYPMIDHNCGEQADELMKDFLHNHNSDAA